MIAGTKVTRAQKAMEQARIYGAASSAIYKHVELPVMAAPLLVACSSDRGLCGGIHSSVTKAIKKEQLKTPSSLIAILGQKSRAQLQRTHKSSIALSFDGVTKFNASWYESALIGDVILGQKIKADGFKVVYNQFKSVIAYLPATILVPSKTVIEQRIFH